MEIKATIEKGKSIEGKIDGISRCYKKQIEENTKKRHTHENKEILDSIDNYIKEKIEEKIKIISEDEIDNITESGLYIVKNKTTNKDNNGLSSFSPSTGRLDYQYYLFHCTENYVPSMFLEPNLKTFDAFQVRMKINNTTKTVGAMLALINVGDGVLDSRVKVGGEWKEWRTYLTSDDIFDINVEVDENYNPQKRDKTYAEILEAYRHGKTLKIHCKLVVDGVMTHEAVSDNYMCNDNVFLFTHIDEINRYHYIINSDNSDSVFLKEHAEPYQSDDTPTKDSDNLITSGGVYNAIGHWELIVNTTLEEEVNSIELTSEEYPDIPKCKEFVIRVVFPKTTTGADIALGASSLRLNNNAVIAFRFSSTTLKRDGIAEQRAHISIIDNLVYSTGTYQATGQSAVTASPHVLIGDRLINGAVSRIIYKLNESANNYPIGTKFAFYGKVN